jgi:hypothetical protein
LSARYLFAVLGLLVERWCLRSEACVYVCMYLLWVCISTNVCKVCTSMYICMYVSVRMCVCVCTLRMCVYVYVCVGTYVFMDECVSR